VPERTRRPASGEPGERAIAIIGMAGRFPGARNVEELWRNLCGGVESVTFFSDEELLAAGVEPALLADPRYVRAGAVLEGIDQFDAGLFGYSPREAEVMDPQHRIFLECAWELFDRAGWNTETYPGRVGVFAGSNLSTYLLRLYADPDVRRSVNMLQAILGNDKDSLTSTVSYKLNLRGPSVAVQTFCSTSLVAVHMASQSLRAGECDMAVAGGIRVVVPDHQGYLFEQGGIAPSDGHSRSFDARADGSVLGHGVGLVLLKRLDDALADGDHIHAVIRGTAINNDGSLKAGYTAPSVAGQVEAITAALDDAGIDPARLGYVEAHGSATELGDPIELAALTQAWRRFTDLRGSVPIGSVKANFGHLDRAAGVTGLIKTVLALENGAIPPNVNFEAPNPKIDFAASPFFVNTELRPWPANGAPRLAAVNSLGMGGTNAHVIIEEAPPTEPSGPARPWQLLVLSAKSPEALDQAARNLADHFESHPDLSLADAAYTLQVGRRGLEHRRIAVCRDLADAAAVLRGGDPRRVLSAWREEGERPVVFLFSGLGGQYVNMGRGLYESEPAFRDAVDLCARELEPLLGLDLRTLLYPETAAPAEETGGGVDLRRMLRRKDDDERDEASRRLDETRLAQPALFVLEYALARLWMEWGLRPAAVAGYSVGEYVAACLAGVLSLSDALTLVAERARLIQELPGGGMLAVGLAEEAVRPLLGNDLSLAAVNGPEQSVVAGPLPAIEALERRLAAEGTACRRLAVTHAFHSRMLEPAFDALVEIARRAERRSPALPLLSNLTGRWLTAEEAVDPAYWARHMCGTVRFSESLAELLADPHRILLELGPGPTLASLVLQHPASRAEAGREPAVLATLRHSYESEPDVAYALKTLGKLWLLGVPVDWTGFHAHARRLRVLLPAYPFERRRYWIETRSAVAAGRHLEAAPGSYLAVRTWKRSALPEPVADADGPHDWLILADPRGVAERLATQLREQGDAVTLIPSDQAPESWTVRLDRLARLPDRVLHLACLGNAGPRLDAGFTGLLALAHELAARGDAPLRLWAVADSLVEVDGDEEVRPEAAALLGACRAVAEHLPRIDVRALDVVAPEPGSPRLDRLAGQLFAELNAAPPQRLAAWRGAHRWVPVLDELPAAARPLPSRNRGTYLLAGGVEEPGFGFARHLAQAGSVRLILLEPSGFPARDEWDEWLRGDAEGVIGRRLARVRELEALDAEVSVVAVDLSDADALRQAVAGESLHGIIASLPPAGAVADRLCEALALDALRRSRTLDFALLLAPQAVRGSGATDAAAAFLLDALAGSGGAGWTSIAWGLGSDEGGDDRIARLLAAGPGQQLVASALPLDPTWSGLDGLPAAERPEVREAVGFYPRPRLRVELVAPRTPTEETIATIWKDLLGLAEIGVHDNFLDLGGDSLLATRLVSRMRDAFHLDLPVRLFFERSTVAELAVAVEEMRETLRREQDAEMLRKVQELSEDELEREIARLESLLAGEV
jgi:acyl transferase domain-containing protein/acyl carrier protein